MLSARILTALLIAPPLLVAMFLAPDWVFELVIGVVIVLAAWEWSVLMDCSRRRARTAFTLVVAVLLVATAAGMRTDPAFLPVLIGVALVWWIFVFGWLTLSPQRAPAHSALLLKGVCGILTLVPAFAAFTALQLWDASGPWMLLYLLALVWLADVGAYFFGRAFGRHKLAPRVSPGKTWEGVLGAYVAAALAITAGWLGGIGVGPLWYFVALGLLTVAVSIVGDLAESMFKRQQGVKDSGTLLPGHGGVLDRIDSLTAAAPLFVGGLLVAPSL